MLETSVPLTVSGNEITDAARVLAAAWPLLQQGGSTDGDAAPAGFGVWEPGTNLYRRGQNDSLVDIGSAHYTLSLDATTPAPFSPQSVKGVGDGTAAEVNFSTAAGLALAAATLCPASLYVKAPLGATYIALVRITNTDATTTSSANVNVVGTGAWQLVTLPALAVAAGKIGDKITVRFVQAAGRVETVWTAHPMLQAVVAAVSPYVATSQGATAVRAAARVQAPASLLNRSQCWAAFRIAYGFPSTAARAAACYLLDWRDDANNLLGLWLDTANVWNAGRLAAGAGAAAQSAAQVFSADTAATVIFACDAATVKVSVNGAPFVSVGNAAAPTLAAVLFDIGSQAGASHLDGRILWNATGTGTLTDADAAVLQALLAAGTYPHHAADIPGWSR